jgi:hypothetical protein
MPTLVGQRSVYAEGRYGLRDIRRSGSGKEFLFAAVPSLAISVRVLCNRCSTPAIVAILLTSQVVSRSLQSVSPGGEHLGRKFAAAVLVVAAAAYQTDINGC